jgi:sec-independent protein translocase protein TatC
MDGGEDGDHALRGDDRLLCVSHHAHAHHAAAAVAARSENPHPAIARITDSFTISFSLAFYAGIVLSFPLLVYFIAEFVLPALTAVEKRLLLPAIGVSFALFLVGVFACYYLLLPKTISFFFRDAESLGWVPNWTVREYYSFVTRFTIGFGLAFELRSWCWRWCGSGC